MLEGVATHPPTDGWPEAWPSAGLRLLHLGRLEQRKRPAVALDALATLRRSGISASLVVAGDGPLRESLMESATALGVSDAVRFTGRVSETDKWRLYDSADVLLFASTLEGFGLVVAEAQSRGVPVVAAAGTATAEALDPDRSGFLTRPDGEAFAACLRELGDERLRLEMGRHAREFASAVRLGRLRGRGGGGLSQSRGGVRGRSTAQAPARAVASSCAMIGSDRSSACARASAEIAGPRSWAAR